MSLNGLETGQSVTPERLKPGYKLLFAGPASLTSLAFKREAVNSVLTSAEVDWDLFHQIMTEYLAIYNALVRLLGPENIQVIKNSILAFKRTPGLGLQLDKITLPDELSLNTREATFLKAPNDFYYACWLRDAHAVIGGKVHANPEAWREVEGTKFSPLGEGGKVLCRRNAVLVTPDIWQQAKREIQELQQSGFVIGRLPFVDIAKQPIEPKKDHIDGHSTLLVNKKGGLTLVVVNSYALQGKDTMRMIRQGAETVCAEVRRIDDRYLPPLALNLEQFEDGTVVMTKTLSGELEDVVAEIVGQDRVQTTEIPIVEIPKHAGSLRCLTNFLPPNLIS